MLLAFDTYYYNNKAKTVGILFGKWEDESPINIYTEILEEVAEYVPGEFYKRELPCILSLLGKVEETIETIIVDGFVYLDDNKKLGLGGHLYNALEGEIPIIGVAKTNFATIENEKIMLLRGQSAKPLYVTSIGMEKDEAAHYIQSMHGSFRFPTLLKLLDQESRSLA